jgi:hypothetical protein
MDYEQSKMKNKSPISLSAIAVILCGSFSHLPRGGGAQICEASADSTVGIVPNNSHPDRQLGGNCTHHFRQVHRRFNDCQRLSLLVHTRRSDLRFSQEIHLQGLTIQAAYADRVGGPNGDLLELIDGRSYKLKCRSHGNLKNVWARVY